MPITRLQSMNNPTEGEAEQYQRASSTLTRKPRVTSRKVRGKKAAKQEETEMTVEGEKEVKDEKVETEAKAGKKRGATEGGLETEEEEGKPKKRGRRGPRGPRRKEVEVVYKEGALSECSECSTFIEHGG